MSTRGLGFSETLSFDGTNFDVWVICMFMGFTIHFYIIFGTNLLTGGPAHFAVLLPVSVFQRKGISNGVQTE